MTVQEMNLTLKHCSGKQNANADALSRNPLFEEAKSIDCVNTCEELECSNDNICFVSVVKSVAHSIKSDNHITKRNHTNKKNANESGNHANDSGNHANDSGDHANDSGNHANDSSDHANVSDDCVDRPSGSSVGDFDDNCLGKML